MPINAGGGIVPDDILLALGKMTVAFSSLEGALDMYIGFYITEVGGTELIAAAYATRMMNFSVKPKLFARLFRFRLGETHEADELKSVVNELESVGEERNFLTHGTWSYSSVAGKPVLSKLKTRKGIEYREMESSDLDNFVIRIQEIKDRLQNLALDGLGAWKFNP